MQQLTNNLVILTGHTSGLGYQLLQLILQQGSQVIGLARRKLSIADRQLQEVSCDLSAVDLNLEQLLQGVLTRAPGQSWQSVTLINNAGSILPVGMMGDLASEAIARNMQLNLTAPLQLCNWLVRSFPQQSLRVAQISSGAAKKAYPGWASYCTAKAGLRMMAQVFAEEALASGQDRRIIVYEPGVIDTPMQAELRSFDSKRLPAVERFRHLHATGQLVHAEASARDLWAQLCSKDMPAFLETRYGSH